MKEEKAEEIAKELRNNNHWHSHERPINIEKLSKMGLKIKDFGEDESLHNAIREFHNLMIENMIASNSTAMILTKGVLE